MNFTTYAARNTNTVEAAEIDEEHALKIGGKAGDVYMIRDGYGTVVSREDFDKVYEVPTAGTDIDAVVAAVVAELDPAIKALVDNLGAEVDARIAASAPAAPAAPAAV